MQDAIRGVHIYPDAATHYLRQDLATFLDVSPDALLIANGSNEVIELIVRTFSVPGCNAVLSATSFAIYHLACQAVGMPITTVPMRDFTYDLDAMAEAIDENTRFVFIANPNNPTGTYVDTDSLAAFLERIPEHVIVTLDEAYMEFVDRDDYPDGLKLRQRFPNLVITRTFSKCYGIAGTRVGYAVMRADWLRFVHRVRAPFNVNLIGQAAARAAIGDQAFVQRTVEHNLRFRAELEARLHGFGLETVPSVTNFILTKMPRPGKEIFEALLQRGVIVRPMAGYGLPNHLRISVGLEHELNALYDALPYALNAPTP